MFTMPNSATFFSNLGAWSDSMFTNYLSVAYFAVGFIVAGIILNFIISSVINAVSKLTKNKYE
jgi:hypothetical protein